MQFIASESILQWLEAFKMVSIMFISTSSRLLYPGKRVTSVLLHEEWMCAQGEAEGNIPLRGQQNYATLFPG